MLGGTKLLPSLLDEVDVVIVAITHSMNRDLYKQLVEAKMRGVMVYEMPTFYERVLGKIPVRHVSDLWFVYVPISGVRRSLYNIKIKKIIDIFLSLFGLLVTLPFTLLAILAIRCSSLGPVFYVHRRIGWNGKPFDLIKLRTMKEGCENDRCYAGQRDDRRCGSAADVHASVLAGTAARCSRLMDWREAPGQKRMAISSADGSARSVRAIRGSSGSGGSFGSSGSTKFPRCGM